MVAAYKFSLTFSVMTVTSETCELFTCRKVMNLCHIQIYFVNQQVQTWEQDKTLQLYTKMQCAQNLHVPS